MSGRIPQHFIDQLVARTDIIEVIGTRVPLRKAGKEYKACCPFHDEKSASFTVVPDKQFFHCFGCGAHGTALGFLMDYDHLSFVEAVEELAARAGLDVPREESTQAPVPKGSPDQYALLEQAAEFYRQQLRNAPVAVEYLKARGLSGEIAVRFGVGYAPDAWDGLLREMGVAVAGELQRAGLVIERDSGTGFYDRFRDRVMFPIRDSRGRTIGFGGRIIAQGEPKYLNSPETELFHKGRELYGLYEARQHTRQLTRLMVVEGYMDVVSLHQAGITYVVATLGTATTAEHLKRLFRVCSEIVFCFDGDRAGRAAAWRALEASLPEAREGRQLRFLFLPEGQDPDSLVRQEGRDVFERRLGSALLLSEYLIQELGVRCDLSHAEGRTRFINEVQELLAKVPDDVYRERLFERAAAALGLSPDRLMRAVSARPADGAVSPVSFRSQQADLSSPGRGSLVRQTIQNLLHFPQAAVVLGQLDELRRVDKPGVPLLVELVLQLQAQPDMPPAVLLERWRTREEFQYINKLFLRGPVAVDLVTAKDEVKKAVERLIAEQFPQERFDELMRRFHLGALPDEEKQELRDLMRRQGPVR